MNSWTARYLSYAGRLQLITSVIVSLVNFWMSAFRLPKSCIQEIDKLCAAFLWSGPDLNPRKSKVSWDIVCRPKREGGLGIKNLVESNKVSCLKLIWRLVSRQPSMWVSWIWSNIMKKNSFWSIKENTSMGSWMWKKLLKYRTSAKSLHKVEIKNGATTSFWFDSWCNQGRLYDLTGPRGVIDMGIPLEATVDCAFHKRRPRRHRSATYALIESSLSQIVLTDMADRHLWKHSADSFKPKFTTRNTWNLIRTQHTQATWHRSVWFPHSTPKFSFLTWLVVQDRLSTANRMKIWNPNINSACILCNSAAETRNHLFFECPYSSEIWLKHTQDLLQLATMTAWNPLQLILQGSSSLTKLKLFLFRYVFQTTIYFLWRERNSRSHGHPPLPPAIIIQQIDKQVRNFLTSIREQGDKRYDNALQTWFSTQGG